MTRRVLPWLLALTVALGAPAAAGPGPDAGLAPTGAAALPGPGDKAAITLRGRLTAVAGPEGAHYRLNEYVVMAKDLDLARYAEQEVEVQGVLSDTPSIFMMPVLIALEVRLVSPAMPEVPPTHPAPPEPAPEPGPAEPPQLPHLPVEPLPEPPPEPLPEPLPEPAPVPTPGPVLPPQFPQPELPGKPDVEPVLPVLPGDAVARPPVTAPGVPEKRVHPMPLHGSDRLVLFGILEAAGAGQFSIGGAALAGRVTDLAQAAGRRVAAVVLGSPAQPGAEPVWQVEKLIGLEADLDTLLGPGTGGLYAPPAAPLRVLVSGQPVALDTPPIMGNGRTMLPIRTVTEALGARVTWDAATRTVNVLLDGRSVTLTVGSNQVAVQAGPGPAAPAGAGAPEMALAVDVAPVICAGRLMVPVRVLSEGLGLRVEWDAATHTVRIG